MSTENIYLNALYIAAVHKYGVISSADDVKSYRMLRIPSYRDMDRKYTAFQELHISFKKYDTLAHTRLSIDATTYFVQLDFFIEPSLVGVPASVMVAANDVDRITNLISGTGATIKVLLDNVQR